MAKYIVFRGFDVIGPVRKFGAVPLCVDPLVFGEINGLTDWGLALHDVNAVVHLAVLSQQIAQ